MTQWDNMQAGEFFDPKASEIEEKRAACQRLLHALQNCDPGNKELNEEIKRELFMCSGDTLLTSPFFCEFGCNISFGGFAVINYNVTFVDYAPIRAGKETYFAPGVVLNTLCLPLDLKLREKGLAFAKPIVIEDDVWLGTDVIVLPGVTVGARSVIGAGSVVTHDIPPDVVAMGKPCRVVRPVTDKDREGLPY